MGVLKRINRRLRVKQKVVEISSANGLISTYALRRARGEGGKPDSKLEALLAHNAQKLKEKQDMTQWESRGVVPMRTAR